MAAELINIGPRERLKRRIFGLVGLAVGVSFAFAMIVLQVSKLPRTLVFFPFWIAGLGLLQAHDKVCIALAADGKCNMDGGEKEIADASAIADLKVKARRINRKALITALAATVVTILFP